MSEFLNIYLDYWRSMLRFEGRDSRKKFWVTFLVVLVVAAAVGVIGHFLGGFGNFIRGLYCVASIIPTIAMFWRRMHDTGREGWWGLIPLLNLLFALNDSDTDNRYGPVPRD